MIHARRLSRGEIVRKLRQAEHCSVLALFAVGLTMVGYFALLFSIVRLETLQHMSWGPGSGLVWLLLVTFPFLAARSVTAWFRMTIAGRLELACPCCDRLLDHRSDWLVLLQTHVCPHCRGVVLEETGGATGQAHR